MNRLTLPATVTRIFLMLLTGIFISGPMYSTGDPAIARYSFDNCQSYFADNSHQNYSELTASFTNRANVQMLDETGHLYRLNPTENSHSCTPGLNGTSAMCVRTTEECDYIPNAEDAVRFDIRLIPSGNQFVKLSKLDFFEMAPTNFVWNDGFSAPNNFPTKYGLRVSVNGTTIYQVQDVATSQDWTLESYSFDGLSQFTVSEQTVFNFELFAYCPVGVTSTQRVWDLEDITIVSECLDQKITNGGEITGGPFSICVDGEDDFLPTIGLLGPTGQNTAWVYTDAAGNILALPDNPSNLNLDTSGSGDCLLWNISFQNGLTGLSIGSNVSNLSGIFDFSNSITITKSQPIGGSLSAPSDIIFCVDGEEDFVTNLTLSGNAGPSSSWIVTDATGMILGLPQNIEEVNFDAAGEGNCFIWNVSFSGAITGLSVGSPLNQLGGCLGISNGVLVTRILLEAPVLTAGPFSFCKDGEADMIDIETPNDSEWSLFNEDGEFIQTIGEISNFDFDGLELGTYTFTLNLTDEDETCSIESNAITVNLVVPEGGTIEGGPFSFCIDGVEDNVSGINLTGNVGSVSMWIITDESENVLAVTNSIGEVNFDDAGVGTCLIWSVSSFDTLMNISTDMELSDLEGCYDLSNSLSVVRSIPAGGTLEGGPFDFCIDDDSDFVSGITISDNEGTNFSWVIADTTGLILGLPDDIESVDFNGAGGGICLIYNISYDDGLQGLEVDSDLDDLQGCFGLSNSISVNRTNPLGGTLTGGPFDFCVDGTEDFVAGISLAGNSGVLTSWIITDEDGEIIGLPDDIEDVNFDDAGSGVCLIWSISHGNDLEGLELGSDVSDLEGCFAISNNLTVNRSEVNGGTLEGGPFSFCIDGTADNVSGITISGALGANTNWVITDEDGVILGLPDDIEDVNFDDAGTGVCLIWSLSSLDGLSGLTVGENVSDLTGCFSFSNSLTVVRSTEEAGTLSGGPFEFMIDGTPDFVSGITISDSLGSNYSWIITDEDGIILGLPGDPEDVDFDQAGIGVCLIWNIAFADGLTGLEVDGDLLDLEGCFDLSNNIMVTRVVSAGGIITGGPFSFCVDGTPDMVSGIELSDNMGTNSQWVVTDDMGIILGLPDDIEDVDFDAAGAGICLIYHLSHEDNITGLATGNDLSDLGGTFALSNSISVTRSTPEGGMLTGGPFEFCVNGIPDMVSGIELTGAEGETISWVVTDQEGNILGLPANIEDVDFDDADAGICLIHNISYVGTINGLEVDGSLTNLDGCFDISTNSIQVNRMQEEGGTLEGGPFNFCVDTEEDFVSGITLTGAGSTNNSWVVTDANGLILELPTDIETIDFNAAGPGECLIYNLSTDMALTGLETNANLADIEGCFGLSNAITVNRVQTSGGVLAGPMSFMFQIDGTPDMVSGLVLTANTGANSQWVVFNITGDIIALPNNIEDVNFDDFGIGTCFIANVSFEDGLVGLSLNEDIADLNGCFGISNNIEVTKVASSGGVLEGGPFSFCIDGVPDMVSGLTLTDNSGSISEWVVVDSDGVILGLPDDVNTVDFDIAGPGVCLIYNISYEAGLTGLAVDNNIADLVGMFGLSNPVVVNRGQPDGGEISGGPYDLCIDGTDDFITDIMTSDISGANTIWAITDPLGIILNLTTEIDTVNFDLAGGGTCQIWNVSYEAGVDGLEIDEDINDLSGCFDLSNSLSVNRTELNGGNLVGGPFSFCIDEDPDMATGISLTEVVGPNATWIVTDADGEIISIEENLGDIDFNDFDGGTCFINHMSFSNGLTGLLVDNNLSDLNGCFDLSQSIEVNKLEPQGGVVIGNDLSICIDDDPDFIMNASVTGAGGSDTTHWLITDPAGSIFDTIENISLFDFNESNFDTCLVWSISYMNGLTGLVFGENIADLDGCFDISNNNIMVVKSEPDGGILSPQSFNICVDGQPDLLDIELTSTSDPNLAWIISDANGLIITLPAQIDTVDFDQYPIGTCFVNSISFDLGLTGLEVGNNLSALDGCFDLSNTVQIAKEDCVFMSNDSIVINEISEESKVELKNVGTTTIDVSEYNLLQAFFMAPLNMIAIDCGTLVIAPGEILVVNVNFNINGSTGELGLLDSEGNLIDYVEWGGSNHATAAAASAAGIWLLGSGPAPAFDEPQTLQYDGAGNASTDWSVDDENLCSDNLVDPINPTELRYSLYPNPSNGELFVEMEAAISEDINISIFDPFGKLVLARNKGIGSPRTSSIDLTELKEGAYIMVVSTKGAREAVRFMKINK